MYGCDRNMYMPYADQRSAQRASEHIRRGENDVALDHEHRVPPTREERTARADTDVTRSRPSG